MVLHVNKRILIGGNNVKDVILEAHCGANIKIVWLIVLWTLRGELLLARQWYACTFHKFATQETGIAFGNLKYLYGIIG